MMTTPEAARYLGISEYYLRNMRADLHNHEGPKYQKLRHPRGWACYYDKKELDIWLYNHKFKIAKAPLFKLLEQCRYFFWT